MADWVLVRYLVDSWPVLRVYALGYAFSVIGGAFFVWLALLTVPMKGHYSSQLLGFIEAILYTTAWLHSRFDIIGAWLVLKVARAWGTMRLEQVRPIFNRWLIGTALSFFYAVVGAEGIKATLGGRWPAGVALALALVLSTLLFSAWGIYRRRSLPWYYHD